MATNPNNPNDVFEGYPLPTSGSGVAEYIVISGTGVTNTNNSGSDVTQATVKLAGAASVTLQLSTTVKDAFGVTVSGPVVNWLSYGAKPTSLATADPAGTEESYPTGQTVAGGCTVSATGLVTATLVGQYMIEARVVDVASTAISIEGSPNTKSNVAYGQCLVEVLP